MKPNTRRRFIVAAAAAALATTGQAQAKAFPSKPIKLIVGFAPGGAVDVIARAVAQQITSTLGQTVLVENKPGAGTHIAMRQLIESPADGHTLMLTANSIVKLLATSKAKPKSVSYGSPGNGSTPHLAVELFARAASIELLHVPYKGGSPAINDVLAGHVQAVAVNALEVQPHVKAYEVQPGPTERLTELIASEQARYAKLTPDAAIKPD